MADFAPEVISVRVWRKGDPAVLISEEWVHPAMLAVPSAAVQARWLAAHPWMDAVPLQPGSYLVTWQMGSTFTFDTFEVAEPACDCCLAGTDTEDAPADVHQLRCARRQET